MKERNHRKTTKGSFKPEAMEKAVNEVLSGKISIRGVTKKYSNAGLSNTNDSLHRLHPSCECTSLYDQVFAPEKW